MLGGVIIKRTLAIAFVVFAYILLTSSIIDYRSQTKVTEAIIDSAMRISEARFGHQTSITEMERSKTAAEIDLELSERLSGRFLLQTQLRGQLWYVNPADQHRYYLGKENEAFRFIQRLVISTSSEQMVEYEYFANNYPEYLAGHFLTSNLADICYVDPSDLGSSCFQTVEEAYKMIQAQALGISNEDLRSLAVGDPFAPAGTN
jgi:hypothetical protein